MTGIAQPLPRERGTLLPTCLVVAACFCFGAIPYFAKTLTDTGMAPRAVAFYRYRLSALLLLPLLPRLPPTLYRTLARGLLSGISVGLGRIGFVSALQAVPVSTVGVLCMTYPAFPVLIGWAWFRNLSTQMVMPRKPARGPRIPGQVRISHRCSSRGRREDAVACCTDQRVAQA